MSTLHLGFVTGRFSRRKLIQIGAIGVSAGAIGRAVSERSWANSTAASGTPEATGTPAHWTYEGEEGPAHWGDLDSAYETCSIGQEQSPVDIINPIRSELPGLTFAGQTLSPINIINNGHTIEVSAQPGITVELDETVYTLAKFHFHAPGEHAIDGQTQVMELHVILEDQHGANAVLGVLLEEGAENPALKPVFDNLPPSAGLEQIVDGEIRLNELLPADKTAYRYDGSLTTPPCNEGVKWIVFMQPVAVSGEQIGAFRSLYPENARPLQPLNGR